MPRAGRNHLDDDLRHPLGPDLIVVLPHRGGRLVDGQIGMALRFQTRDQQLALTTAGDSKDDLRLFLSQVRELLADRIDQFEVPGFRYVDHGHNSPAQFVELSFLGLGMLEFLEAHSSPLIGRYDSGDGLATHGLFSTGPDGGPTDTSRGIASVAGARQTLSSQGW